MAEPNNAALYDARRRQTVTGSHGSQVLDNIVAGSNFDRDEVDRLRKRFMKLDKVGDLLGKSSKIKQHCHSDRTSIFREAGHIPRNSL